MKFCFIIKLSEIFSRVLAKINQSYSIKMVKNPYFAK